MWVTTYSGISSQEGYIHFVPYVSSTNVQSIPRCGLFASRVFLLLLRNDHLPTIRHPTCQPMHAEERNLALGMRNCLHSVQCGIS